MEQCNAEYITNSIDYSLIDKIFNRSVQLDGESIIDFISCLCDLSEFFYIFIQYIKYFIIKHIF